MRGVFFNYLTCLSRRSWRGEHAFFFSSFFFKLVTHNMNINIRTYYLNIELSSHQAQRSFYARSQSGGTMCAILSCHLTGFQFLASTSSTNPRPFYDSADFPVLIVISGELCGQFKGIFKFLCVCDWECCRWVNQMPKFNDYD